MSLIHSRIKLHRILGKAHLSSREREKPLQRLSGHVVVLLAEGIAKSLNQVLNSAGNVGPDHLASIWIDHLVHSQSDQCRIAHVVGTIRPSHPQGHRHFGGTAIQAASYHGTYELVLQATYSIPQPQLLKVLFERIARVSGRPPRWNIPSIFLERYASARGRRLLHLEVQRLVVHGVQQDRMPT